MNKNGNVLFAALAITACAFFVAPPAAASTITAVDLPTLRDMSDVVVVGVVEGHRDGVRGFTSEATIRITESFKGPFHVGDSVVVTVERGNIGDADREVVGEARYDVGKRTLVFLQQLDGEWLTVALGYGKFDVTKDRRGRDMAVRSPEGIELGGGPENIDTAPVALDELRPILVNPSLAPSKRVNQ
jgi:hypothetical protein